MLPLVNLENNLFRPRFWDFCYYHCGKMSDFFFTWIPTISRLFINTINRRIQWAVVENFDCLQYIPSKYNLINSKFRYIRIMLKFWILLNSFSPPLEPAAFENLDLPQLKYYKTKNLIKVLEKIKIFEDLSLTIQTLIHNFLTLLFKHLRISSRVWCTT